MTNNLVTRQMLDLREAADTQEYNDFCATRRIYFITGQSPDLLMLLLLLLLK
jgi:hypothetical protein